MPPLRPKFAASAIVLALLLALPAAAAPTPPPPAPRVSTVAQNGMPKNIVPKGAAWNFGTTPS